MKRILQFCDVYINETSTICGPKEEEGPLSDFFDLRLGSLRMDQKSFEKAEIYMQKEALSILLNKSSLVKEEVDVAFGGDLLNQEVASSYTFRDFKIPFVGIYGACSTSVLAIIMCGIYLNSNNNGKAVAITSSHNATSERQFRNPNEYGGAKADTVTSTVTGCGAALLSHKKSHVKLTKAMIGKIIDLNQKNMFDMGRAMAPAACETLIEFFNETNTTPDDYDLILTGDLSKFGSNIVQNILDERYGEVDNYNDCGLMIYNVKNQKVFAGGSGCACCALVSYGFIIQQMNKGIYNKVLIAATGALMNTTMTLQKESIPGISHIILLEREE